MTLQIITDIEFRPKSSPKGKRRYLWRAVDQDGDLIDILVQKRKDTQAVERFFRKLLCSQTQVPIEITTGKLPSYAAAKRQLMSAVPHCRDRYANNRAEVSHEHTREQERQMRGFRSDGHAQRFSERSRPVQQSVSARGSSAQPGKLSRHAFESISNRDAGDVRPMNEGSSTCGVRSIRRSAT